MAKRVGTLRRKEAVELHFTVMKDIPIADGTEAHEKVGTFEVSK
jgi:hypothetical protein